MEFLDYLDQYFENGETEELKGALRRNKSYIWRNGLPEDSIHHCVQIFLEKEELSNEARCLLLECLVPREKIPLGTGNALLAWFFSNFSKEIEVSKAFLSWLSAMLENNLIERKPVESLVNRFLMCFFYSELVGPICQVLKYTLKPGSITPRSVFITEYFYYKPIKWNGKKHLACLLRLFHETSPALVPNPPKGNGVLPNTQVEFRKSVSSLALRNGFVNVVETIAKSPKQSAKQTIQGVQHTGLHESDSLSYFLGIKEMRHLGWSIKHNKIPPLQRTSSLVGFKEGQIYVCWKTILGSNSSVEDMNTILPILKNLLEICHRTRNGLPILQNVLSRYLISWDGEENEDTIYSIISWIHFESFEGLYANILYHVINLFLCGLIPEKIKILDCLTDLIANKVNRVSKSTILKLITLVNRLIKIGLAIDGLCSPFLLLSSLRFYNYVSLLEERYMLGTWTIPVPFVVFGAFFSNNHVLISEICELLVRHITVMYPFFIATGLIQDFSDEEIILKTYLRDLYLFLWKGQACNTELIQSEEEKLPLFNNKEMNPIFSVRKHFAIQSLTSRLASQLGLEVTKRLNDKSILKLFTQYAAGLSMLKTTYENGQSPTDTE